MRNKENNYTFINSQNLNLSVQSLSWELDFKKFAKEMIVFTDNLREKLNIIVSNKNKKCRTIEN